MKVNNLSIKKCIALISVVFVFAVTFNQVASSKTTAMNQDNALLVSMPTPAATATVLGFETQPDETPAIPDATPALPDATFEIGISMINNSEKLLVGEKKGVEIGTIIFYGGYYMNYFGTGTSAILKRCRKSGEKLLFSSDNPKVATVNKNGIVTAKKPGKAKINIFYETIIPGHNCEETVNIRVVRGKIGFVKKKIVLWKGDSTSIRCKVFPSDVTGRIKFSIKNKDCLKIKRTKSRRIFVKAVKKGKAWIVAKEGHVKVKCRLIVK